MPKLRFTVRRMMLLVLGMALPEAVAAAKAFVGEAIERGREVKLGTGDGPLIQAKLR